MSVENEDIMTETTEYVGFSALNVPSVYNGDVPLLAMCVDNPGSGGSIEVGKLWGTGGQLSFEGNADESARVFFDNIIELNRELLEPPKQD